MGDSLADSVGSPPEAGLGQNRDFLKLWGGESVSLIGTVVSQLAIPLIAVLQLEATPTQLGFITAAQLAPILVVGPVLGHLVDSIPRRPVLVWASAARATVLAVAAVLVLTGALQMWSLVACALGLGTLSAMFDIAWYAYFPSVVPPEQLVRANSFVQTSYSVAQVAGSGLGGWLMKVLNPAVALGVDSVSYLVAAVSFSSIKTPERREPKIDEDETFVRRFTAGFRVLWRERVLRAMLLEGAWFNFCEQAFLTVFLVFAVRELGMPTDVIGLCIGLGSLGAVTGGLSADRIGNRIGSAKVLVAAMAVASAGPLLAPAAQDAGLVSALLIITSFCCYGFGLAIYNIHSISERQRRVHSSQMGRASAAFRTIAFGAMPLGAIFGGVVAEAVGTRTALVVIAGMLLAAWVPFSVTILRTMPHQPSDVQGGT